MVNSIDPPKGLLEHYERNLDFGQKTQAEHGKWLINTLYLLHSGAIVALLSKVPSDSIAILAAPLKWFISGIALAFLAGLATWTNYYWLIKAYSEMISTIRSKRWRPGEFPSSVQFVSITMWIALTVGLASFFCLLAGAWTALGISASK